MKRFVALVILLLAVTLPVAHAQSGPDDQYLFIYGALQQADASANSGQTRTALQQYTATQIELKKFQKIYPEWNPHIVNFRLKYVAEKIAGLTAQLPASGDSSKGISAPPATNTVAAGATAGLTAQLNELRAQLQNLQTDNGTLAAKLKEALASQPAAIDSRELSRAQEQIRSLMKENDLLRASVAQGHAGSTPGLEAAALAEAQQALTAAYKKLAEQTARADKLAQENQKLLARPPAQPVDAETLAALREENALLKQQMAELKAAATNEADARQLRNDLEKARLQIAALQSDLEVASLEKIALENRVKQVQENAAAAAGPNQAENEERIRQLTQERDNLLAKLGAANKELYGAKKQDVAARINDLTDQVNVLRARIAVDEAQAVPYTAEELALFRQTPPLLANPNSQKKSIKEMPDGSMQLVAEAQTHFAAKEYDAAADDYLKILQRDENNSLALANLAAIELEQGKLEEAEKHLKAALVQKPDDAYNLSTLGYLKFRQEKYDDALDALSRAAKLDPQNPEIQNYLGVTLSHKGLRTQAETALRKAIQLSPNYGPAHNNLAVIYLGQTPPLVQLARYHYQKSLNLGGARNPDLEKMLDERGLSVNPQP